MSYAIKTIANMPTDYEPINFAQHESVTRAYHIVAKLRELIELETPHAVILEILTLLESDDFQPYAWHEAKCKKASVAR